MEVLWKWKEHLSKLRNSEWELFLEKKERRKDDSDSNVYIMFTFEILQIFTLGYQILKEHVS